MCGFKAGTNAWWRAKENRRYRRAEKEALRRGREMPHRKGFQDPWNSPGDGKGWNNDLLPFVRHGGSWISAPNLGWRGYRHGVFGYWYVVAK